MVTYVEPVLKDVRYEFAQMFLDETGIGQTSAVGMFPDGASPYGLLDMSGNVFEHLS